MYFWSVFGNNPTFRYIFEPKMNQKSKFFARVIALASIIPFLFLNLEFIKFEFTTELRTMSTQIYHISSMIFSILTLDRSSGKFSPKVMSRSSWRILRLLRSGVFTRFRKEKALYHGRIRSVYERDSNHEYHALVEARTCTNR